MVSITLAVPSETKREMDSFPEMNWSAVAREAIKQKLLVLENFKEFTKNSTLTQEDALRMGAEVNKKVSKRYVK
jgi:hypothetical protein